MRVIYRYDIDRKEAFDLSKELEMKIEFQDVNRTVSYTHLDVYKRQVLGYSLLSA